jgi:hypothetical protein
MKHYGKYGESLFNYYPKNYLNYSTFINSKDKINYSYFPDKENNSTFKENNECRNYLLFDFENVVNSLYFIRLIT